MELIEDRFIAAIQDDPNDLNNKKVYVDWLQEQGRQDEAMYLLFNHVRPPIEWMFKVNPVIEVKCPKCGELATKYISSSSPMPLSTGFCYTNRNCENRYWFNFLYHFEPGNIYKFANATYKYYGGRNNLWWVKI